jgi:pyridoxamine 5'-phosphate oxidase
MTDLAPWRPLLARALHRNRALPYARYFQLATVRANGRVANRTVVFRGFLPESNQLAMITDGRSAKIEQIQKTPWAEICWYFPKTREQFRLSGQLNCVDPNHPNPAWQKAYHEIWQNLSNAARQQFYWPAPGQPHDSELLDTDPPTETDDAPETFRLLVFESVEVDRLDLRPNPPSKLHSFHRYRLNDDGSWQIEFLTP